ncbi:MAG: hypothetical protein PVG03_13550 [Desulfarculaceae bacterium]|jgi:hypothetical protein
MPQIPAVCDKCGKVELSSVLIKDNTYHIKDYVERTCECGGSLRILDGTYTHLGGPINFCRAPEESLIKFKEITDQLSR